MQGVSGVVRIVVGIVAIAVIAVAAYAVVNRMALDNRAAERRALLARQSELTARALAPGSALACLDGGAGETVGNACEKAVFADAASTAAALALTAARLTLLQDATALEHQGEGDLPAAFATIRRSVELDRFGLAAQVLVDRDSCTADTCAAFALVSETGALKANMKARVYEQYVSRYAPGWGRAAPESPPQASAAPPAPATPPVASAEPAPASGHPVDPKWDFPSAASIPPVSIMSAEPARPKDKEAPEAHAAQAKGEPNDGVPVPPKRPQAQAPNPAPPR